jgi:hypothetical protein
MDARVAGHRRLLEDPAGVGNPAGPLSLGLLAVWIAVSGCTLDSAIAGAGVPGTSHEALLGPVRERGRYLDVEVDAGGFDYRLFFPNVPACQWLLVDPKGARFEWLGVMGRLTRGDDRCDAIGVLSLAAWRDRQPRRSREPLPRSPARYLVVYDDADLLQLEGRFPLAGQLGFTGTAQLMAVVPNDAVCRGLGQRGTASMEYRVAGPDPLVLLHENDLCRVIGLAQPPPPLAPQP